MKKSATIYDVSELAGVSTATVSRVLNDPGKVSEKTRKRVENAIEELDYKPLLEVRLRSARDVTRICVCSPHFTSQSFVQRLRGISDELQACKETVELQIFSVTSASLLDAFIETLPMRGLDGVIFLSLELSEEQIQKINQFGVACVTVERESALCSTIINDNFEGGRMAARYLIEKGYQDFGLLCEPYHWDYTVYTMAARKEGYISELEANGFTLEEKNIFNNHLVYEDVKKHMTEIFRSGHFPKAFFATADIMAFGMLSAALDCGLKPGKDIAVIGFDDLDFSDVLGLTTISQHLDESGRIGARLLMNKIHQPESPDQHVKLDLTIIERTSV